MRTIFYFDTFRNRKRLVKIVVLPLLFMIAVCIGGELVDLFAPQFNDRWMRWPGYIKDIFSMSEWNSTLAGNLFQIFYMIYPMYLFYHLMNGINDSVIGEKSAGTDIFTWNMGIKTIEYGISKVIYWIMAAFLSIMSMMIVQFCFVALFRIEEDIVDMIGFYVVLFVVSLLYISIAWFVSSYVSDLKASRRAVGFVIFGPILLSRCPSVLRFLSEIIVALGGGEALGRIGNRIAGLEMMAPLLWGCNSIKVNGYCVVCAMVIFVIMNVASVSIYKEW